MLAQGLSKLRNPTREWPAPSRRSFPRTFRPSRSAQGGLTGPGPGRACATGGAREAHADRPRDGGLRLAWPAARAPLRIRRSRLTHDLGQRRTDRRVEAARIEAQLGTTLQLVRDAALDELDAEALLARGARGGAAALLPFQPETFGVLATIHIP